MRTTHTEEIRSATSKPNKPKAIQEAIFQVIGLNKRIEIQALEKSCHKILARGEGRYIAMARSELTIAKEREQEDVYPEIRESLLVA